jgi:iron(II)-dependent oxidoreductase
VPVIDVLDSTMFYEEVGAGVPFVFLHGNPASSYLWRNVLPGIGAGVRCLAPDLIGMGRSGKPELAYSFDDHARYLDAWIEALELEDVVLVGIDWGGALAFDWANHHPGRVRGIAFMETIVKPLSYEDFLDADGARKRYETLNTPGVGETMVLEKNMFLEVALAGTVATGLTEEELAAYKDAFPTPESRVPMLRWARSMPLEGKPADVAGRVEAYDRWLASSEVVPKLLVAFEPSAHVMISPDLVAWCESNIAGLEVVNGGSAYHLAPEDRPGAIATRSGSGPIATGCGAPARSVVRTSSLHAARDGRAAMTVDATATTLGRLDAARERTLGLVEHLSREDLERQIDPIMSPLVWDLGHIAAYEDLWIAHRHGGRALLRPELASLYDAFETPRAARRRAQLLGARDARVYLDAVRERTLGATLMHGIDPLIYEMVLRHELQHTETMRQAMALGGLLPDGEPPLTALPEGEAAWHDVPAGPFDMGAADHGFAYDNERPRHVVELAAFRIAARPTTNATFCRFVEAGGYVRREWWSDEGWAWKERNGVTPHRSVTEGDPAAPACHVSWFEAEALAGWHGARLPTEAEWERAADLIEGVGLVWEWTASEFTGYPGFKAHPYPEYSEPFFDQGYRVLRGGSWATAPEIATRTFRNWDLPQRRQIFAGVRLACDIGGPL